MTQPGSDQHRSRGSEVPQGLRPGCQVRGSGEPSTAARARLREFLADLIAEGARAGVVRADVPAEELADYALGALSAVGRAAPAAAIDRLVEVTLTALRPPARAAAGHMTSS